MNKVIDVTLLSNKIGMIVFYKIDFIKWYQDGTGKEHMYDCLNAIVSCYWIGEQRDCWNCWVCYELPLQQY